jgi:hypothetical protein
MLDAILEATRHRCQHAPDSSDAKKKRNKSNKRKKKKSYWCFSSRFFLNHGGPTGVKRSSERRTRRRRRRRDGWRIRAAHTRSATQSRRLKKCVFFFFFSAFQISFPSLFHDQTFPDIMGETFLDDPRANPRATATCFRRRFRFSKHTIFPVSSHVMMREVSGEPCNKKRTPMKPIEIDKNHHETNNQKDIMQIKQMKTISPH